MKNNSKLLNKELNKRDIEIVKMILSGESLVDIASKYGVTKQRIHQISNRCKLKAREIQFDVNKQMTNAIYGTLVERKMSPKIIKNKLGLTDQHVRRFLKYGVDMRVYSVGAYMKECDKFIYDHYMEGYLAHEIVDMFKKKYDVTKRIGDIYVSVKRYIKSDRLPKRVSRRHIKSKELDDAIIKVYNPNKTDTMITKELNGMGVKNVNGGKLCVASISYRIDKKLKLR